MYTNFVVEKADRIATITLNRPEKRNPINEEMGTFQTRAKVVDSLPGDTSGRAGCRHNLAS